MRIKVKPAKEGSIVRDPISLVAISQEGHRVDPKDPFWMRRLKDGDVVVVGDADSKDKKDKKEKEDKEKDKKTF